MSKRQRYLEFGKPVVHQRPPDATPADLVEALNRAALGRDLPAGWDVDQRYRNSPRAEWKSIPVERMVRDSANRGGDFIGLYLRYLAHQAHRLGVRHEEARRATAAEAEAAEAKLERISEREAGAFEELAKKQKRSKAAKKGAETKRLKKKEAARKKEAAARKRKSYNAVLRALQRTHDLSRAEARVTWRGLKDRLDRSPRVADLKKHPRITREEVKQATKRKRKRKK